MHARLRSLLSLPTLLLVSSVSPTSAQVKFEEQTLVEDVTSASVTVSPRGVNVAAVIPKGSRQAVVYDGVEGPRFDAIATPGFLTFNGTGGRSKPMYDGTGTINMRTLAAGLTGPTAASQILFNPQGTHFAYVGRSGTDFALMLDGKEIHRAEYQMIQFIAFTPDGERLVAIATSKDQGQHRVIIDGQAGPWFANNLGDIFFTPDGKHYAYVATQPDVQQTKSMVVDGKQVKYLGEIVGFAPSGFLFTRVDAMAGITLLGNGKPMTLVSSIAHLAIAPKTGKLIMLVKPPMGTPPRDKPSMLTVDGQIIPGTEGVNVTGSWFSPDGKRYAVLCTRYSPQQETFMIVDGKKELIYQDILATDPYKPSFSPDSSKFVYVARAVNGQTFVVVDGEESDGMQGLSLHPTWSPIGSRLAWGGTTPAQRRVFFIDGKSVPLPPNTEPGGSFRFTPDGAHTSWSYGGPNALTLMVDGAAVPNIAGMGFIGGEGFDGRDATVKFSPDGKHVVYAAREPKDFSKQGIWMDGKFITPLTAPQVNRVTFTPDSQHVAWAVSGLKDNRGVYRVFVDGREVLAYNNSMADVIAGAWEMGDDGTLTFLGADGSTLKRYRIPPPADSSITTMLAAAK